jgi:hypothetical protein
VDHVEAKEIFQRSGLVSPFWNLGEGEGMREVSKWFLERMSLPPTIPKCRSRNRR